MSSAAAASARPRVSSASATTRVIDELCRRIDGIRLKVLSERLRALERAGWVARRDASGYPRHVSHALTPAGRRLGPLLRAWERGGVGRDVVEMVLKCRWTREILLVLSDSALRPAEMRARAAGLGKRNGFLTATRLWHGEWYPQGATLAVVGGSVNPSYIGGSFRCSDGCPCPNTNSYATEAFPTTIAGHTAIYGSFLGPGIGARCGLPPNPVWPFGLTAWQYCCASDLDAALICANTETLPP